MRPPIATNRPLPVPPPSVPQSQNKQDDGVYIDFIAAHENEGLELYEDLDQLYVECEKIRPDPTV